MSKQSLVRVYMFAVGNGVLMALYFGWPILIYSVLAVLLVEGLSNLGLTRRLAAMCNAGVVEEARSSPNGWINIDAVQAWQFVVFIMLATSYLLYQDSLWVLPWFIGFALAGAGLSGVCPFVIFLRTLGFR